MADDTLNFDFGNVDDVHTLRWLSRPVVADVDGIAAVPGANRIMYAQGFYQFIPFAVMGVVAGNIDTALTFRLRVECHGEGTACAHEILGVNRCAVRSNVELG